MSPEQLKNHDCVNFKYVYQIDDSVIIETPVDILNIKLRHIKKLRICKDCLASTEMASRDIDDRVTQSLLNRQKTSKRATAIATVYAEGHSVKSEEGTHFGFLLSNIDPKTGIPNDVFTLDIIHIMIAIKSSLMKFNDQFSIFTKATFINNLKKYVDVRKNDDEDSFLARLCNDFSRIFDKHIESVESMLSEIGIVKDIDYPIVRPCGNIYNETIWSFDNQYIDDDMPRVPRVKKDEMEAIIERVNEIMGHD